MDDLNPTSAGGPSAAGLSGGGPRAAGASGGGPSSASEAAVSKGKDNDVVEKEDTGGGNLAAATNLI